MKAIVVFTDGKATQAVACADWAVPLEVQRLDVALNESFVVVDLLGSATCVLALPPDRGRMADQEAHDRAETQ